MSNSYVAWLVYRGKFPGPLFLLQSGAPLTRTRLVKELRTVLSELGLEAELFSGHSFRKGAATTAAARGISDSQIKVLGRWRSSAFQRYIHPSRNQVASLAARLSQNFDTGVDRANTVEHQGDPPLGPNRQP